MRDASELRAAPCPDASLGLERVENCPPDRWRYLYQEVGRAFHWTDRLAWTDEEIHWYLSDPAVELWVLVNGETPAGYFELRHEGDSSVAIAYFGLLPPYIGRGLGKYLLTLAVQQAWASGARRVWLHTSSLDHPSALPNYLARGFRVFRTEQYEVTA